VGSRVNARFEYLFLGLENYCGKVNTDRPISQQPSCSSGNLVSGNIKIMWVFAGVPEIRDSKRHAVGLHVMRASIALYAEVYALCA